MTRITLPNRRPNETIKYQFWGHAYHATFGRSWDGDAGNAALDEPVLEVFINAGKFGDQLQTLTVDSAILLSLALQYGVPLSKICHALSRNPDGTPLGPIGALVDEMLKPVKPE